MTAENQINMTNSQEFISPEDIGNCEKELLHLSGEIQSYGALLVVDSHSLLISHASQNIEHFTGDAAQTLLGTPLWELAWFPAKDEFDLPSGRGVSKRFHNVSSPLANIHLDIVCTHSVDTYLIEFEMVHRMDQAARAAQPNSYRQLFKFSQKVEEQDYFYTLLQNLQANTRCERVLIYRFEPDWTGEVVSEISTDFKPLYIGLHFPASDIPAIARRLYYENPWRYIPDTLSPTVPLAGCSKEPPDLTYANLRSVSPVHLQYLKNMKVAASFSIPIIISGKFWGLVSCHHSTPHRISLRIRRQCENLVQQFSLAFYSYLVNSRFSMLSSLEKTTYDIMQTLQEAGKEDKKTERFMAKALNALAGDAAILCIDSTVYHIGSDIDNETINALDAWFVSIELPIYTSDNIAYLESMMPGLTQRYRGLMAMWIKSIHRDYRLYICRLAEPITVDWAGKPEKIEDTTEAGEKILTPRHSFERWTEVKAYGSPPWEEHQLLLAKKIRHRLFKSPI